MARCFVISPFGSPGSDVRNFADRVFDGILRPALEPMQFTLDDGRAARDALVPAPGDGTPTDPGALIVERADQSKAKFGQVMERVALSIVNDDLVVAVLWDRNPNVYYELAIAHAAARPVVMLKHVDEQIPFDVQGQQFIEFDMNEILGGGDVYRNRLIGELRHAATLAMDDFHSRRVRYDRIAFNSPDLDPLGDQHNKYVVYETFRNVKYEDWSRGINECRSFIRFAGVSLFDLTRIDNNMFSLPNGKKTHLLDLLLIRIILGGVDVHVMVMDENNPGLAHMLHTGASQAGVELDLRFGDMFLEQVRHEIMISTMRWQDFGMRIATALEKTRGFVWPQEFLREAGIVQPAAKQGSFSLTKIKRGLLYNRLSMTDQEAIITPFFFEYGRNGSGPAVRTVAGTPLYKAHYKDYDYLVSANADAATDVGGMKRLQRR